ncbi:MAG: hypothetical protein AB1941_20260 [Gemmatimonadota bacterium]
MALSTARRIPGSPELHQAAWWLTGTVFTILGISTVLQLCVAAPWAYFAGKGTPVFDAYLRLSPIGNHSRGFLVVAYGAMLAGIGRLAPARRPPFRTAVVLASFAAMIVGAWVGWKEGSLVRSTHYTATAIYDSTELIFLLAGLFIGVVWNTTDRLLWIAVVIFTVHELFDVVWYSALAWSDVPNAWRPPTKYIHLYASVAYLLMIFLANRRMRLARKGVRVPGLLEFPQRAAGSMIG